MGPSPCMPPLSQCGAADTRQQENWERARHCDPPAADLTRVNGRPCLQSAADIHARPAFLPGTDGWFDLLLKAANIPTATTRTATHAHVGALCNSQDGRLLVQRGARLRSVVGWCKAVGGHRMADPLGRVFWVARAMELGRTSSGGTLAAPRTRGFFGTHPMQP